MANYKTEEEKLLVKSLKAFVCAAIVHWMSNNWEKVENLQLKEKPEVNGGCVDNDSVKKNPDYVQMSWLPELIANHSADILDSESVKFFVKKAQKQQLQTIVAKINIKKNINNLNKKQYGSNSVNKKVTKKTDDQQNYDHCSGSEEQCDEKFTKQGGIPVSESESANSVNEKQTETSETVLNGNKSQQEITHNNPGEIDLKKTIDLVEKEKFDIKPSIASDLSVQLNDGSAETLSLSASSDTESKHSYSSVYNYLDVSKLSGTKIASPANNENFKSIEAEINLKVQEINDLDKYLQKFEAERVSAPSPFVAYTNVKYLIDNLVKKQDVTLAQRLQENCDQLWAKPHD